MYVPSRHQCMGACYDFPIIDFRKKISISKFEILTCLCYYGILYLWTLFICFAAKKHGISEVPTDVVNLISHATQERLRHIVEKLSTVAEQRMEIYKVSILPTVRFI